MAYTGKLETMKDWKAWLTEQKYIPLDKSWVIRMGFLDLTHGYKDIVSFLESQEHLGDDLNALLRVCRTWKGTGPIDVGESGTILRFVRYYLWKNHLQREILVSETLEERSRNRISNDPNIVYMSPEQRGELDNRTSQWLTVAYVFGDHRKVERPKFKLRLTYKAVEHWEEQRRNGQCWEAITDYTITKQVLAFIEYMTTGRISSKPEQPEDFFFYEMFGIKIDPEIAYEYESLQGHETKRLDERDTILRCIASGGIIPTKDHRGVTAAAAKIKTQDRSIGVPELRARFTYPDCVNKAFPRYWECMQAIFEKLKI